MVHRGRTARGCTDTVRTPTTIQASLGRVDSLLWNRPERSRVVARDDQAQGNENVRHLPKEFRKNARPVVMSLQTIARRVTRNITLRGISPITGQ